MHGPLDPETNYRTTDQLTTRMAVWRPGDDGRTPMEVIVDGIVALGPERYLDVGTGTGALPAAVARRLAGCRVQAVDRSDAMVEASRAHGVAAQQADIAALPFPAASFDVVSATWMLYHVTDLDAALHEVARVLRPGGTFVAATNGIQHLGGLFDAAGQPRVALSFTRENGAAILGRIFANVRRQDLTSYAEFPDAAAAQAYLRTIYPDAVVPPFTGPRRFPGAPTVFWARN